LDKKRIGAYDYAFMGEQDDRGRWALATRREVEKAKNELKNEAKNEVNKIAKNLLRLGLSIEIVAQNTGLIIEEVEKLSLEK